MGSAAERSAFRKTGECRRLKATDYFGGSLFGCTKSKKYSLNPSSFSFSAGIKRNAAQAQISLVHIFPAGFGHADVATQRYQSNRSD